MTVGIVQPSGIRLVTGPSSAFQGIPTGGTVLTRTIPGLGEYRLAAHQAPDGDVLVAGLPLQGVEDTVTRLVLVELVVAGSGLVVAGVVGSVLVRRNLEPLQRVATTATRVAPFLSIAVTSCCTSGCRTTTPTRTPRSARSRSR